jgi:phenylacetate-coenzyme A ligase PaaK-like adenylate-forming protein
VSERAPEAVWGPLADAKLASLVALAIEKSPFHRDRLVPVASRAELAKLPVLDKDAWMAASPPHSSAALTRRLGNAYVFRTGGSTGDPKFSVFATAEFRAFVKYFKRTYHAAGLRPSDRVANLFACGSLYASFIFVNRMLEATGCLNFPFTTATEPAAVARHVKLFGINTLVGFPSWLLQVADALEAEGVGVEKIFYAGEHLYPDERQHLARRLGARVIASAGYAAVDAGMVGYQCEAAGASTVHHLLADHAHLEILHPETLQPADEGLVVVTNLDRRLQPVIRYNLGDMARHVPGGCACGRTAPRFELLHRGDDSLRIGFATLTYTEVQHALSGLVGAIQLERTREARKDRLTIRVEGASIEPNQVLDALQRAKPDLAKLLASGYLHPLHVEVVAQIPRLPVSGKLKRVIDLA